MDSDEDFDSDGSSDLPLDMDGSDDDMEGVFAPAEDFNEEDVAFSGIVYDLYKI